MLEELKGKERAALRTAQLKERLLVWEGRRDVLCDEIAYRRGQIELLEQLIKEAYESILNVNKEEQKNDLQKASVKAPPKGAKTPRKKRTKKGGGE